MRTISGSDGPTGASEKESQMTLASTPREWSALAAPTRQESLMTRRNLHRAAGRASGPEDDQLIWSSDRAPDGTGAPGRLPVARAVATALLAVLAYTITGPLPAAVPTSVKCGQAVMFDDCTIDVSMVDDKR